MKYTRIPGLENYGISKSGNIWSFLSKKLISQHVNPDGYMSASLVAEKGKGNKPYLVHRLLGITFLENPELYPTINHLDGNKLNNRLSNLEWCSYSENTQHSYDTGLQPSRKGENHGHPKLTDEKVKMIRAMEGTQSKIAKHFGVHQSNISLIRRGKAWSHVA